MRNCLHSLISYGPQSASLFSIINNQLSLGFYFFYWSPWPYGVCFYTKMVGWNLRWIPNRSFRKVYQRYSARGGIIGTHLLRRSEALLTLTSMCGKGPLEFSGTLIGGMTQSRFCLLSPLAADPLWCFRENLMTLGWESQTLDSISVMPAWNQTEKSSRAVSYSVTVWWQRHDVLLLRPRQDPIISYLQGWSLQTFSM